jgi:hypothetical protein
MDSLQIGNAVSFFVYFLCVAFFLKILWNILIPFILATRALKSGENIIIGIPIHSPIECVLLAVLILVSFINPENCICSDPLQVAMLGVFSIGVSYILLFVLAFALGSLVCKIKSIETLQKTK